MDAALLSMAAPLPESSGSIEQHAGAVRDRGFGLRLHGLRAALRVLHLEVTGRETGGLERLCEEGGVVLHVTRRRLRVREEGDDLALYPSP